MEEGPLDVQVRRESRKEKRGERPVCVFNCSTFMGSRSVILKTSLGHGALTLGNEKLNQA